MNPERLRRSQK